MLLTEHDTLEAIAEKYPELLPLLAKNGLAAYFEPENLKKLGRFTRLGSVLHSLGMEPDAFLANLNAVLTEKQSHQAVEKPLSQLHFMAMLPCGLRNPFKDFLEAYLLEHPERYVAFDYLADGNVNHELSYYPLLDQVSSAEELPEIMMASDVNNFFHQPFKERFVGKGIFQAFRPDTPNSYLEKAGFADPSGTYTMFTANMLVMAVDTERLGPNPVPKRWSDLLSAGFENEIVMRGEDDFFCNAIMLPFYKEQGFDAIRSLARNIRTGKHPAEMVKMADKGGEEAATIYILPYFFAKKIKNPKVKLLWPEDGAIASPVFLMIRQTALAKHQALLDFLFSKQMGEMLVERSFPSIHPDVVNTLPEAVKWLGWDFLNSHDVGQLKDEIRKVFLEVWTQKTLV